MQIHDDLQFYGVGKSWGRSGDFWQWESLLAEGTSAQCTYLTFGLSSLLRFGISLKVALKIINWSFRQLYIGEWDKCDWMGKDLKDPRHLFPDFIIRWGEFVEFFITQYDGANATLCCDLWNIVGI